MPVEFRIIIWRKMLRVEREKLFVFGDNLERYGMDGQAGEMRGEPNAVGLPTKRFPSMQSCAMLNDDDLERIRDASAMERDRLLCHVRTGGIVVWPARGIGTGLARLGTNAPAIAAFYAGFLRALQAEPISRP